MNEDTWAEFKQSPGRKGHGRVSGLEDRLYFLTPDPEAEAMPPVLLVGCERERHRFLLVTRSDLEAAVRRYQRSPTGRPAVITARQVATDYRDLGERLSGAHDEDLDLTVIPELLKYLQAD